MRRREEAQQALTQGQKLSVLAIHVSNLAALPSVIASKHAKSSSVGQNVQPFGSCNYDITLFVILRKNQSFRAIL